jgi:hypothetical protein
MSPALDAWLRIYIAAVGSPAMAEVENDGARMGPRAIHDVAETIADLGLEALTSRERDLFPVVEVGQDVAENPLEER